MIEVSHAQAFVAALQWASDAAAGEYLIEYDDDGAPDAADDPGSRCGFSDPEIEEINRRLRARDLCLTTDDRGLCATAVRS